MYSAFHIHLKILRNHKFYNKYRFPNSVRDREKEIETGDGQMNRTGKGGGGWKLFRGNTKTFLNVTFGMIPDSVDQMLAGMKF